MKPTVTWVVLANARMIRVLAHRGPGKGLTALGGKCWRAPAADLPRDRAGVGHSIAGPGVAAVAQSDTKLLSDQAFAREVAGHLVDGLRAGKFDRLALIAGPHMLGVLRGALDGPLKSVLVGEIPKDLSARPLPQVESHLGELIAV